MIYKKIRQSFFPTGNAIIEFPTNRKLIIIGITLFVNSLNPEGIPDIIINKEVFFAEGNKTYKDKIAIGSLTIVNNNLYYYLDNFIQRTYYGFVIPAKTDNIVILPIHTNMYKTITISTSNLGSSHGYLEVDYAYIRISSKDD